MNNSYFVETNVSNRDIPILAGIPYLKAEIESLEQQCRWQRDRMQSISYHLTGMPRQGRQQKGLDTGFTLLEKIEAKHSQKCKEYTYQLRQAEKIINGISSQSMRAFVRLRYVSGDTDTRIMAKLGMSRRGIERAKKCVDEAPCMAAVKWQERFVLADD